MKNILLKKIRLTHYFIGLVTIFTVLSIFIDGIVLDRPILTLFSVNSFLYGFYISPIIKGQRDRIDMLHKLVRIEAAKLYEISTYSRRTEDEYHQQVAEALNYYAKANYKDHYSQTEPEFEDLVDVIIGYKGSEKDPHKEMMKSVFAVQQNRTEIDRLLVAKVYRNEWVVMAILFSITISFILLVQLPGGSLLNIVPPVLCAGLSMLMVILAKMSTLTHKSARTIWDPMRSLSQSRFTRINH